MWICYLRLNMGRHHLITNQWCKLLTDVREITNNDNDPQGTVVHSAWSEWMFWCRTPYKAFRSKASDVNLSPKVRKLPWGMKASRYWKGVSKSTSWIMCWYQQEATCRRRALMYPTSMTRNKCNDFWRQNLTDDTRFRNGIHENEGLWVLQRINFNWVTSLEHCYWEI